MNNTLILRRSGFQAFQGRQFWLQVSILLSMFGFIGAIYYVSKSNKIFSESFFYFTFVYAIYLYLQNHFLGTSKLEVDEFGLSHESGIPEVLKRFLPDWKISWAEIQSIEKEKNVVLKQTVFAPLKLILLNRTIKIIPNQWVNPDEELDDYWWFKYNAVAPKVKDDVLVKIFQEKGFLDKVLFKSTSKSKAVGSDLNSNPISIGMMFFLFFAMFYFITEVYFTLSEFYASKPPYIYMIICAVAAVIVSYFLLLKTKFALAEKLILALLMGGSMAAVMYPLMLRVNQWTDDGGLQSYPYVKSGAVSWTTDRQNYQIPSLTFDLASSKYWAQFEIGDTKEFELRKGGLGFYQLNMEPVYAEQRVFYKDK